MPPLSYENIRATVGFPLTAGYQWDGEEDGSSVPVGVDLSAWTGQLVAMRDGQVVLDANETNGQLVLGHDGSILIDVPPYDLPPAGWYAYQLRLWTSDPADATLFAQGRLDVRDTYAIGNTPPRPVPPLAGGDSPLAINWAIRAGSDFTLELRFTDNHLPIDMSAATVVVTFTDPTVGDVHPAVLNSATTNTQGGRIVLGTGATPGTPNVTVTIPSVATATFNFPPITYTMTVTHPAWGTTVWATGTVTLTTS